MAGFARVVVPEDVLETLKCDNCGLLLSVPPISYTDQRKLTCGRCTGQDTKQHRAVAFERVAKLLLFPCRYVHRGCFETTLLWDSVREHEELCSYKPFPCPSSKLTRCGWNGKPEILLAHFKEQHKDLVLRSSTTTLTLNEQTGRVLVKPIENYVFVIHVDVQLDVVSFNIYYVAPNVNSEGILYQLQLKNVNFSRTLFYEGYAISQHKLKTCKKLTLSKKFVMSALLSKDVLCNIDFVGIKDNAPDQLGSDSLSKDLKCPNCGCTMMPPIFLCASGHSSCGKCKESGAGCAVCSQKIKQTRNFTLEKLTNHVTYECKHSNWGCAFKGNSEAIAEHQGACPFVPLPCPLNKYAVCDWEGSATSQPHHVRSAHLNAFRVLPGQLLDFDLISKNTESVWVMAFDNQIFKITCKQNSLLVLSVQWAFEHIGLPPFKLSRYRFRVEFLHVEEGKRAGTRLFVDSPCFGAGTSNQTNCLSIPYRLLIPSIEHNRFLIFKYYISKM